MAPRRAALALLAAAAVAGSAAALDAQVDATGAGVVVTDADGHQLNVRLQGGVTGGAALHRLRYEYCNQ
jgi:hypothetical protein